MITLTKELWDGRRPLEETFWLYAVVYGLLLNLVTSLLFLAMLANEANTALLALTFVTPIPYNIFVVVAVWRSADSFAGPGKWADLARIGVGIWMIGLTLA
ncbi:MAG: hypothetical protein HN732_19275 [Rhodospirillaceae bacterium]|jgi:hypothetical protein|nr:hypothetical protein [Rhodospirillaceae bacterium]MBT5192622.1 hypothetical protein [Rhodospirillaceae bacterium]MBT5899322.1 hypothetical protein [Rhodospirillaceae bacterium]MBT7759481.1 hypothetical protein [Rhodospirillaceae bacterium]